MGKMICEMENGEICMHNVDDDCHFGGACGHKEELTTKYLLRKSKELRQATKETKKMVDEMVKQREDYLNSDSHKEFLELYKKLNDS